MKWDYRVCKERVNSIPEPVVIFTIREVYYNDEGDVIMVSSEPASVESEDIEGVAWTLEKLSRSLSKDTLDLNSLHFWK